MKNVSAKLQTKSLTGPELVEIFDFLYVDRARISAYYAQLFPQGILTSIKTTSQETFSDDQNFGPDLKIFKAESKSTEGGSRGVEQMFDATWSVPLEVLERLKSLSLIQASLREAGLGSLVLADCHMRIIDFATMDTLWEPSLRMAAENHIGPLPSLTIPTMAEVLKAAPKAIHAHLLSNDGFLWSSLQPTNLTIPTTDITLKYGGAVPGLWTVLYILDSWPDSGEAPDVTGWSGGPLIDAVLTAMHGLRILMGRPSTWYGVTPLMIFRNVSGWRPPDTV